MKTPPSDVENKHTMLLQWSNILRTFAHREENAVVKNYLLTSAIHLEDAANVVSAAAFSARMTRLAANDGKEPELQMVVRRGKRWFGRF